MRKYKLRKDILWKPEIVKWLRSICPAREHGYQCRQQILDDLNAKFGTSFSMPSFVTHCYEHGIQFGFASSSSKLPRGEKHWRHREVGEFQYKKGYLRIKVAEPNQWMQFNRFVWEQHHPGQSAEGKVVIFMDGDNNNFNPDNLECITRGEQSVMAELGCTKDSTREERELYLLQARVAIAKHQLLDGKGQSLKNRLNYQKNREDPAWVAARKARYKEKMERIRADPVLYAEHLAKQKAQRDADIEGYRRRAREWARKNRRNKCLNG